MKTSELIERLNGLIETYGDHDIRIDGNINEEHIAMHVWYDKFFIIANSERPL